MPADSTLIAVFIRKYLEEQGAPWCGDNPQVKWAHITANQEGAHHCQEAHPSVSYTHMKVLKEALDTLKPKEAAIWDCACCSQYGCRRLSETTIPSKEKFNPKFHITKATCIDFKPLEDGHFSCAVDLPWTKSTCKKGRLISLTPHPFNVNRICPVSALKNHLKVNKAISDPFPLFAYIDDDRQPKHLTKKEFLDCCYSIWKRASLYQVQGHNFHIGGAIELLLAGVPPEVIAQIGGWTSLTFLLYWHWVEEIFPKSTYQAYKDQHSHVSTRIEQFCISHKIPSTLLDFIAAGNISFDNLD
ncbi:tyrosine recombinase [Moniliophthora roreri MCA 2997]|uniref:Tyrosine recombinase n=1 Tax=Moniliophthora roreri (strain MCA 2997) TaxID=1381753 RepID=V2XMQ1_MONRO|nr:tyrosine recombinase [Moniliophthora roreri MCA 2997]